MSGPWNWRAKAHAFAPYSEILVALALAAVLLLASAGCASTRQDYPEGAGISSETRAEILRASCVGGTSMDVGPIEVNSNSYPCEILRTYAALEATEGRGWLMGALPRFFLKTRLVTKGIFSAIAGLVGLG